MRTEDNLETQMAATQAACDAADVQTYGAAQAASNLADATDRLSGELDGLRVDLMA